MEREPPKEDMETQTSYNPWPRRNWAMREMLTSGTPSAARRFLRALRRLLKRKTWR